MKTFWHFFSWLFVHQVTRTLDRAYAMPERSTFLMLQESREPPDINELPTLMREMKEPLMSRRQRLILKNRMGAMFDAEYMSIDEPASFRAHDHSKHRRTNKTISSKNRMKNVPPMSEEVKNLVFVGKRKGGSERTLGRKTSDKFRSWLWNLSKCPVRYKWVDLGPKFFPRYLKRGHCSKKKTCSFPAGMKCKEDKYKPVMLLIYICLPSQNYVNASCKWRSMRSLKVLEKCKCSCTDR